MTRIRFLPWLAALLCLLAFSAASLPAYAAAPGQIPAFPAQGIANTDANLRAGPGTTFARVGSVKQGAAVEVVACNDGCTWYRLASDQWIAASLVDLVDLVGGAKGAPAATPAPTAPPARAAAKGDANLRSGPGQQYTVVGSAAKGQPLSLVGRSSDGAWYALADGSWISATLVSNAPRSLPVKPPPAAAASGGLGLSRAELQAVYEAFGFTFTASALRDGRPRVLADRSSTIVELIGPAQNVQEASVVAFVPGDDPDEVQRIILYMLLLANTVLPDWDAAAWLADHIEEGVGSGADAAGSYAASIAVDGKLVTLKIEQSIGSILLIIAAK